MANRKNTNANMEDHEADAETKSTAAAASEADPLDVGELYEFRVGHDRTPVMGELKNKGDVVKLTAKRAASMRRGGIVLESMDDKATEATAKAHAELS